MQIGDLVRRAETIDPRIGIVQDAFKAHGNGRDAGKLICVVSWHNGQFGHYFSEHLEALCK